MELWLFRNLDFWCGHKKLADRLGGVTDLVVGDGKSASRFAAAKHFNPPQLPNQGT